MNQKILLIAKASIKEGLGHFIRSITLANYIHEHRSDWHIDFLLITDLDLKAKVNDCPFAVTIAEGLSKIHFQDRYDKIILDMLSLSDEELSWVQESTQKIVSISPIFNQMAKCDLLITRTQYLSIEVPSTLEIKAGLEYSIIRSDCHKIDEDVFVANLNKPSFSIAISMGGTDPFNNTLEVLKALKTLQTPCVFWVMLGVGYEHNYDELVSLINKQSQHEIILAKTNKSMWQIMSNCSLAVLMGGITSYESAYAGLPAINYFDNPDKSYLVQELNEKGLSLPIANSMEDIINSLNIVLTNPEILIKIFNNTREVFLDNPIDNIIKILSK